jgi:hypothetical protein
MRDQRQIIEGLQNRILKITDLIDREIEIDFENSQDLQCQIVLSDETALFFDMTIQSSCSVAGDGWGEPKYNYNEYADCVVSGFTFCTEDGEEAIKMPALTEYIEKKYSTK